MTLPNTREILTVHEFIEQVEAQKPHALTEVDVRLLLLLEKNAQLPLSSLKELGFDNHGFPEWYLVFSLLWLTNIIEINQTHVSLQKPLTNDRIQQVIEFVQFVDQYSKNPHSN